MNASQTKDADKTFTRHIPVLLQEVIESLNIKVGGTYMDCNLGDGGHSEEIAKALKGKGTLAAFDLDQDAIDRAQARLEHFEKGKAGKDGIALHLFRKNFRFLKETCDAAGIEKADGILFDLGLSSYELDASGRGFSFRKDEPLLMTFGATSDHRFNASTIVNTWNEDQIERIIRGYGEDKFSLRIARRIVEDREVEPIRTTQQLADLIKKAVPAHVRFGKIHPATKTFQALRITVNDELSALEDVLPQAFEMLAPKGRLVVMSYHSLEDRIVKHFFKDLETKELVTVLTKRPITSTDEEIARNPRARSAKMRVIEKL